MSTRIVYFDETGDDGITTASSDHFILTSIYMSVEDWQCNYNLMKNFRKDLRNEYGLPVSVEMHTKHFLTDKNPYRQYNWTKEQKQEILKGFTKTIAAMKLNIINVVIDKKKINREGYSVLESALKYNIQRIENDSKDEWKYMVITDSGRLGPMRKTARAIRVYNPIRSKYSYDTTNQPIKNMIEDIMEKDSSESYFIQMCDFVSYFIHLYFDISIRGKSLPNRVANVIDNNFVGRVMATLKEKGVLNLKASSDNKYGLVIYPK